MKPFCLVGTGGGSPGISRVVKDGSDTVIRKLYENLSGSIYRLAISPDATIVAASGKDGTIQLFRLGQDLQLLNQMKYSVTEGYRIKGNPDVYGLSFLSDTVLAVAGADYQIRIVSIENPEKITRLSVLECSGIVFGLTALDSTRCCGIVRSKNTEMDSLRIWNYKSAVEEFAGPEFKICTPYLSATIDFLTESGLIVHGDRSGNLHTYHASQGFEYRVVDSGHKNFGAVCFTEKYLVTAGIGDGGMVAFRNPENPVEIGLSLAAGNAVLGISRFDSDSVLLQTADGRLLSIALKPVPAVANQLTVADIRHCVSLPSRLLGELTQKSRSEYIREKGAKVKHCFERNDVQGALLIIEQLSREGYTDFANELLIAGMQGAGRLLSELEALLNYLESGGISNTTRHSLDRLIEVLILLNEPELAISALTQMQEAFPDDPRYEEKIWELEPYCIPDSGNMVCYSVYQDTGFICSEIRKSEILRRHFRESALLEKPDSILQKSDTVSSRILFDEFSGQSQSIFTVLPPCDVYFKEGMNISLQRGVLQFLPDEETGLTGFEYWCQFLDTYEGTVRKSYKVFNGGSEWCLQLNHSELIATLERIAGSEALADWYAAVEKKINHTIVTWTAGQNATPQSFRNPGDGEDDLGV